MGTAKHLTRNQNMHPGNQKANIGIEHVIRASNMSNVYSKDVVGKPENHEIPQKRARGTKHIQHSMLAQKKSVFQQSGAACL